MKAVKAVDSLQPYLSPFCHWKHFISGSPLLTNHPVHIFDDNNHEVASALIPFCGFGTDMKIVGKTFSNFSFPVCDSFRPTLLRGKACYKLEVNPNMQTKVGIEGGLTLMVDQSKEKSVAPSSSNKNTKEERTTIRLIEPNADDSAEIYLPTIASHTSSRPGNFRVDSLKVMTVTESFTKLPLDIKNCVEQKVEDCENDRLMKASLSQCGCLPWSLKDLVEVGFCKLFFSSICRCRFSAIRPRWIVFGNRQRKIKSA